MSTQVLSDETRTEMRRQANQGMTSALWEYCPKEFLMLLDEYEMLLKSVQSLPLEYEGQVYSEISEMRLEKANDGV